MSIFKISYIVHIIVAMMLSLPIISVYSEEIPTRGPIPFTVFDKDGNGFVNIEEFNSIRKQRLQQKTMEGRQMRGINANLSFSDLDSNHDEQLTMAELTAGQQAQMKQQLAKGYARNMGQTKNNNQTMTVRSNTTNDSRQLIKMPEQARNLIRKDMINNLSTVNMIISYLADNNFDAAADVAETGMGISTMGKHRGSGTAPGRYMSTEMHNIGRNMHQLASDFSNISKQSDIKKSLKALEKLTSSCVACHNSYRTQ